MTREVLARDRRRRRARASLLLNKVDRLDAAARERLAAEWPDALLLSARDPADVAALRERILAFFERDAVEDELVVPYAKQQLVGELHASARVLAETHDEHGTRLRVRAKPELVERIRTQLAD